MSVAGSLASSLVAVVVLAAAAGKLADAPAFRRTLTGLRLPGPLHDAAFATVVSLEGGLGLLILIGIEPTVVRAVLAAAALGFVIVNAVAARTAEGLECRCFGQLTRSQFGPQALYRSVGLFVIATFGFITGETGAAVSGPSILEALLLVLGAALFATASWHAATVIQLVEETMTNDAG
jgi:uncharacterized membrane protein YphA (DoxX/SURF4 family)